MFIGVFDIHLSSLFLLLWCCLLWKKEKIFWMMIKVGNLRFVRKGYWMHDLAVETKLRLYILSWSSSQYNLFTSPYLVTIKMLIWKSFCFFFYLSLWNPYRQYHNSKAPMSFSLFTWQQIKENLKLESRKPLAATFFLLLYFRFP